MTNDLTAQDVAERLKTTASTVRKMCGAGELPGAYRLRPGRPKSPWRIPEEAIEEHRRRKAGTHVPRSRQWREKALAA